MNRINFFIVTGFTALIAVIAALAAGELVSVTTFLISYAIYAATVTAIRVIDYKAQTRPPQTLELKWKAVINDLAEAIVDAEDKKGGSA